jgi:hypothetical protein
VARIFQPLIGADKNIAAATHRSARYYSVISTDRMIDGNRIQTGRT